MEKMQLKMYSADKHNKFIPLLRKFTGLGISEITNRVLNEQSIVTFNSFDDDECETVNRIIIGVQELGGEVKIFNEDYSEELSIEHFYNLQKRREETSKYLQDITDLECTKILISINQESLGTISNAFTIINQKGDGMVIELEFNNSLMDLLQIIVDNKICAKVYQVEIDQGFFDEEDEVSPIEILDNYKGYFG